MHRDTGKAAKKPVFTGGYRSLGPRFVITEGLSVKGDGEGSVPGRSHGGAAARGLPTWSGAGGRAAGVQAPWRSVCVRPVAAR